MKKFQKDDEQSDPGVLVFASCSPSTCNIATSDDEPRKQRLRRRRNEDDELEGLDERGNAVPGIDPNTNNGRSLGLGSGIVWDSEGHIVTNYHVINGSNAQLVTLHDGKRCSGQVVGVAPDVDLALLKIDAPKNTLKPVRLGLSKDVKVGQRVYAIGSPFGLHQTLTAGIVSGMQRSMSTQSGRTIYGVVQTDAAINPGSSGGPLLNIKGMLIGVNTMIASSSGSNAGVGFAIPVDTVVRVVKQLLEFGEPRSASLGVICASKEQAKKLGVYEGALVMSVLRNSGAEDAGIRGTIRQSDGQISVGDVVIALNSEKVASVEALVQIIEKYEVDDEVELTILRDGAEQQLFVKLQKRKLASPILTRPRVRSKM